MIRNLSVFLLTLATMLSVVNVVCQAVPQPLLTRHVREVVVNGQAQSVGRLPATQSMRFDIVLALRHQPELENFVQELYDPSSPSYKHYVTPKQFTERFGPSQEDYDALVAFAKANGFKSVGGSRDSRDLQFTAPVANINRAFHITMGVYQHPTENRTFFSPDREPTADLPFQVWHISGLDNYSVPRPALSHRDSKAKGEVPQAQNGSCPWQSFCGSDMRAAYYGGKALTGKGQNIAILEFAGTDLTDLAAYYKGAKQRQPFTPTLISTGGYSTTCLASNKCDDTEQTLDMTQAMGMAPGLNMLYMYVCGDDYGSETFSETACYSAMVTDEAAPLSLQISVSWGWFPADPSTDDPYYEQMAAQGQSIFVAAGDSQEWVKYNYPYPAEDANVITVGGTDLTTTGPGGDWASEVGWEYTGGGISPDKILIPIWQQLSGVITEANDGSTVYRNGPDVTANANWSFYVCADQSFCSGNEYGGTSFAAPMWAGYLALANQRAAAKGNPAPGFINPTIYALGLGSGYAAAFHDITSGNNGFSAEVGYDLDSGWGSPNGAALINALTGPAGPSFTLSANPTSATIAEGSSGTSTITITPADGFSGSVTLSASGLPGGVTAEFNPNPATTTSTLTLTASATAATGTVTVAIGGMSGTLTNTATLSLTVSLSGPALSPTSLTWGQILVGKTTAAKKVTLTNTGGSALNISTIVPSGDFALATVKAARKITPCVNGGTVAVGASCEIAVTFTPTQAGTRTGDITFTDNAANSPQQLPLTGIGREPKN